MEKLTKVIYGLKVFLLIIHFYFVFIMLHNVLDVGLFGYILVSVYSIYIIKNIMELLSKKKRYQNDTVYNLMQIGLFVYIIYFAIKINANGIYVTNRTYVYFRNNYIILCVLIIFILIYSIVEFNKKKKI